MNESNRYTDNTQTRLFIDMFVTVNQPDNNNNNNNNNIKENQHE